MSEKNGLAEFSYICPMCRKKQHRVIIADLEHGDLYKRRTYNLFCSLFSGDYDIELMETDLVIRQFECPNCNMIIQGGVEESIREEYEKYN